MWSGLAVVFGVRLVFEMEVVCQLLFRLLSSLLSVERALFPERHLQLHNIDHRTSETSSRFELQNELGCKSAVGHGALRLTMSYPRTITPTVCIDHLICELRIVTESLHEGRLAILSTLGQSANWPNMVPILPNVFPQ
jgi:hypothetical protein